MIFACDIACGQKQAAQAEQVAGVAEAQWRNFTRLAGGFAGRRGDLPIVLRCT